MTTQDVEHLLDVIKAALDSGEINENLYLHYMAFVLFGVFTGQRPQATTARLTVGQFRAAVASTKPVLNILPEQDKIRMQHYCPLHTQVTDAVMPLLDGRADDEIMFNYLSFERWLKQQNVPLIYGDNHWLPGDLRKFCEQMGDVLQWDQSNKNYILTHGISGVDWRFYKSPRPEPVYDIFMEYWKNVTFTAARDNSHSAV